MGRGLRLALVAAVDCAAAWAVLLFGLGNVGLQQSVSLGWQVLVTDYLAVTLVAAGAAFLIALVMGAWLRTTVRESLLLAAIVALLVAAMSWLVAPLLIGELEFEHGALTFPVLSVLGLLPLGALAGSIIGGSTRGRGAGALP